MKKVLMVLVAVVGVAGLVAVASAHMGGSGYGNTGSQGYGWMGSAMGNGWTGPGMGPGAMHSGRGGGWMSWMGNMFGTGRTPHRRFDQGRPAETPHAAPDSTTR